MYAAILLPDWVTNEHAITLATWGLVVVTLFLVVATFLLLLDSWNKGKDQQARWAREDQEHRKDREEERARWLRDDEIRLDQLAPKIAFGVDLAARSNDLEPVTVWCANLGSAAVHVESISVCRLSDLGKEDADFEFSPHLLANSGEMVRIEIPSAVFGGLLLRVDIEIWCNVATAHKHLTTNREAYSFFLANQGQVSQVRRGLYESRIVSCPSCGSRGFLDPKGLSKSELLQVMETAERELADTCPNHSSTVLRSVLDLNGVRTWSRENR